MQTNDERSEVFRGHLEECVRHLQTRMAVKAPRGTREATAAKKPIAEFCGVAVDSVTRWLHGSGGLPKGDPLLKFTCFLNLQGYRIIEWERTKAVLRNFAEIIGFGLLSTDEALRELGYGDASTLYNILRGSRGSSKERVQKMWEVWKARKEELEEKKKSARTRYVLDVPKDVTREMRVRRPPALPAAADRTSHAAKRRTAVVHIMEGLADLLDEGLFAKLSKRDLQGLKHAGGKTILRLSAHLSAVSSQIVSSDEPKEGGST